MEIICWEEHHAFFSYSVALPSIVLWGLGIPIFGLIQIFLNKENLEKISVRKKYGFLYRGYKKTFYYWDILIMYRKIFIIALAVFLRD